jgi:two-component system, cell cycle response regulator DivK
MATRQRGSETRVRRMILIVDDDADARSLLGVYFQGAGYRVTTAANGNEAIAAALRTRPSAIVLDLDMPGLDGWGAMRVLRSYATTANIPLVAWSGLGDDGTETRAMAQGFDAVIQKPCAPDEVERAIDGLLTRAPSNAGGGTW